MIIPYFFSCDGVTCVVLCYDYICYVCAVWELFDCSVVKVSFKICHVDCARAHLGQLKEGSRGFKLEKVVYYAGEVNMNVVEEKLVNLAYKKVRNNKWIRGKRVVRIIHSSEFRRNYIRIWWREKWKDDYAIVFDYSGAGGPVCIVPVPDLFMSDFVKEKRRKESYANSGYWWSQNFPIDHGLVKLVLSFEGRWDFL